jgi:hypothetical protein
LYDDETSNLPRFSDNKKFLLTTRNVRLHSGRYALQNTIPDLIQKI